jgi:hypothetical protein
LIRSALFGASDNMIKFSKLDADVAEAEAVEEGQGNHIDEDED